MMDLRCNGCGRRVGFTTRTQAVPVQCTDPWCAAQAPVGINEERDSFMEYLVEVEKQTPELVGEAFGMTRQNVARVLSRRSQPVSVPAVG